MKIIGRIPPTAVLVITHFVARNERILRRSSDGLTVAVRLWRLKK
jgi:hypothetical protein